MIIPYKILILHVYGIKYQLKLRKDLMKHLHKLFHQN